jgi:Domain of unknown function (DUF4114)/Vanadium chloroperoxidase N-terminal domain
MQNLTGTTGADRFVVRQAGSTITGFNAAEGDRIIIDLETAPHTIGGSNLIGADSTLDTARLNSSETLTNFDLLNPQTLAGYARPLTATATGVEVRIPDADGAGREVFVTISTANLDAANALVNTFATSTVNTTVNVAGTSTGTNLPAFEVRSRGNTVVDWNDVTVDAARMANVPPAASTRYFALVHAAINDAVQGISQTAGRQTYLQSQGVTLAAAPTGANADVAAAAAAASVLTNLFTDSANPVSRNAFTPNGTAAATTVGAFYPGVFNAALNTAIQQSIEAGASQASIQAGLDYGRSVARAISSFRQTDGYLRNEDGSTVDPAAFSSVYRDGIEGSDALNENDGTVGVLTNGSNLIGTGAAISTIRTDGTVGVSSSSTTTPGAWRRGEDTLNAVTGQFANLASPEVAEANQTWFLPKTSFFNNSIGAPPALDSTRYVANVREVAIEGSLADLPGVGDASLTLAAGTGGRTTTVNGVTSNAANAPRFGATFNDTDTAEAGYEGVVGADVPTNLPTRASNGVDGVGTTSLDRTIIGHIWANAEGSYGPNYAYQKIAQQLAINNNESLATSAYQFAALDLALADGFANLWDAKWDEDYFWRPVSSIRNADQIAATASLDDDNWTPRENTPQHPCHPSGTSATAGIATTLLASFYGEATNVNVSADINANSARLNNALINSNASNSALGAGGVATARVGGVTLTDGTFVPLEEVSRNYTSFTQLREETRLSRIYAGAHFRFATERGVQLGTNVANYFLDNNPFLTTRTAAAAGVFSAATGLDAVGQARWLASGARDYEFGSITVDNRAGTINGLSVGDAAYTAAALDRRNVIFSGRSDASGQAINSSNIGNLGTSEGRAAGQVGAAALAGNTIFYVTENGQTTFSNAAGGRFSSTSASGLNQLTFRDSANQDVRFEVGAALPAFRTNGVSNGASRNVTVAISRAAEFNNTLGIYAVDDAEGCFLFDDNNDGVTDRRIEASNTGGYLAEAIRRATANPALNQATTNNATASSTLSLRDGQSFGLLLVSNNTLANATTNNTVFSYSGANSNQANQIVRLGNGTTEVFGFEDQIGGGDRDFNDLIVSITKS